MFLSNYSDKPDTDHWIGALWPNGAGGICYMGKNKKTWDNIACFYTDYTVMATYVIQSW